MRSTGLSFVVLTAVAFAIEANSSFGADKAASDQPPQTATNVRLRILIDGLDRPIDGIERGEVALPLILEVLTAKATHLSDVKDPAKRVTILIDSAGFRKHTENPFDAERIQTTFSSGLQGTSLKSLLKIIADQFDGVVLVRSDFLEIVHRKAACAELNIKVADDQPMPALVSRFFDGVPLENAFSQIADGYNVNVVLCPTIKAMKLPTVTTKLINVPFDTAIDTLAAMGELRVVRRANVYFVTTKEKAAEMEAEELKQLEAKRARLKQEIAELDERRAAPKEKEKDKE